MRLQLQEELQQKEYHRIVMILIVRILHGIVGSTTLKVLFAHKAQPTQLAVTAHTDENTGLPLLAIRHCDPSSNTDTVRKMAGRKRLLELKVTVLSVLAFYTRESHMYCTSSCFVGCV